MARSMTGYGRSELTADGRKFTVEMKSVNNRYLDLNIRMPRIFNQFESAIKGELKNYIARGKVDVFISYEDQTAADTRVTYNKAVAEQYVSYVHQMALDFGLPMNLTAERLSAYPDVLTIAEEDPDNSSLWEPLRETLCAAAQQFVNARVREGDYITADLVAKLDGMTTHVDAIAERAPEIVANYRQRLADKMKEVVADKQIDESRILQEAAIYSDKVCVDEEMVRLRSHISAVRDELVKKEPVGRKLDFLVQEMNREANTILSKTVDTESAGHAIELKTEIEKIREQIQNIE